MPKMMLGMPASSSIAVPIGRRNDWGQDSVRNTAMPMPTGTANSMAINDVTSVP